MAENKNTTRSNFPGVGIGGRTGLNRNFTRVDSERESWKKNADDLNTWTYGAEIQHQSTLSNINEQLARIHQELGSASLTRRERLMAIRQNNLNRMAQLYGDYYQEFGSALNDKALDFLDRWARVKVPTFTSIMAGYEHARASRADRAMQALGQQQKLLETAEAIDKERAAIQDERDANARYMEQKALEQDALKSQALLTAEKAYIDQARENANIYYGAGGKVGTRSGAGGGFAGGVTGGAMSFDGGPNVPAQEATQGQQAQQLPPYVPRAAVEGTSQQQAYNDAVQRFEATEQQLLASEQPGEREQQYRQAEGGSFWSNPFGNTWNFLGGGNTDDSRVGDLAGYAGSSMAVSNLRRAYLNAKDARALAALGQRPDAVPRYFKFSNNNVFSTYYPNPDYAANVRARRAWDNSTRALQRNITGRNALTWSRGPTRLVPQFLQKAGTLGSRALGWASLVPLAANLSGNLAGVLGGAGVAIGNAWDDFTGERQREIDEAVRAGKPIPQRETFGQAYDRYNKRVDRWLGFWDNPTDIRSFTQAYETVYGQSPSQQQKVNFDAQVPAVRYGILEDLRGNNAPKSVEESDQLFVDNVRKHSNLVEQYRVQAAALQKGEAIQAQEQQETVDPDTGEHKGFAALKDAYLKEVQRIGYNDLNPASIGRVMSDYVQFVPFMESNGTAGAEGAMTSTGTAKSRYQIMDMTFDQLRKDFLREYGDTLSDDERTALRGAKNANDLDTDDKHHLLGLLTLYYPLKYENNNRNIGSRDGKRLDITNIQMFADLARMRQKFGNNDDPYYWGNMGMFQLVSHGRVGQNELDQYVGRLNKAIAENFGFGYRRDNQGGNVDWIGSDWVPIDQHDAYRRMLASMYNYEYDQPMISREEYMQALNAQQEAAAQQQSQGKKKGTQVSKPVTVSSNLRRAQDHIDIEGLNSGLLEKLNAAADEIATVSGGRRALVVNSGRRTREEQERLYRQRGSNPNKVAKPGHSKHERGDAVDLNVNNLAEILREYPQLGSDVDSFLKRHGLRRPDIKGDPVHVILM